MKKLFCAFGLLSLTAVAQQAPAPAMRGGGNGPAANAEPRTYVSAADIAARVGKGEEAARGDGPLVQWGPFRGNMEWHTSPATSYGVHENDAELFVVLEGSGGMTFGGTLVDPSRNGTNLSAKSSQGSTVRKLAKGDILLVPENTVHAITQVDGKIVLLAMHLPRPAAAAAGAPGAPAMPAMPGMPAR